MSFDPTHQDILMPAESQWRETARQRPEMSGTSVMFEHQYVNIQQQQGIFV